MCAAPDEYMGSILQTHTRRVAENDIPTVTMVGQRCGNQNCVDASRTWATTFLPSSTMATTGPLVMYSTRPADVQADELKLQPA